MNGNGSYPFERNRYFAGKMLTSADFEVEQRYGNSKRQFLNSLLLGSGIVCGCNVYSLDDLSILVESGCVIDNQGREIVIGSSIVQKLSAIEGFNQIDSNRLTLCIRYKEEKKNPVYSVKSKTAENEYEYNRVEEGYELFLLATEECYSSIDIGDEFLISDTIYLDPDYLVTLEVPANVCKNHFVKMKVKVSKHSDSVEPLNLNGIVQMPCFLTQDNEHELNIDLNDVHLAMGESVDFDYWVMVQEVSASETVLIYKGNGDEAESVSLKVLIENGDPGTLVDRTLGKMSLEMKEMSMMSDYVPLVDISLVRTESAYIIDYIDERKAKNYIQTPAQGKKRSSYLNYFRDKDMISQVALKLPEIGTDKLSLTEANLENGFKVATGTLEIPVGGKARAGEIFYSGEIMHGLGSGTVYVEIGQEFIEERPVQGSVVKSVVYGNTELFPEFSNRFPEAETAVKILNDKGSFVAAARFDHNVDVLVLTYRWIAIKFAGGGVEQTTQALDQWIEPETPTAVIAPRESFYFGVKFHNMEQCSISYEVTDPNGGSITADGVYTAPNKEGVYEIKISVMNHLYNSTFAYAVVRNK